MKCLTSLFWIITNSSYILTESRIHSRISSCATPREILLTCQVRSKSVIYTLSKQRVSPSLFNMRASSLLQDQRQYCTVCLALENILTYLYTTLLACSVAGSFVVRSVTSSTPMYSPIPLVKKKQNKTKQNNGHNNKLM